MTIGEPLTDRVSRRPGVVWRDLPTSLMILEPDDTVIRLVGAGRLLWLLLDEPTSLTDLEEFFESIGDEAGGPSADLAAGVPEYLARLDELGLIEVGP